MQYNTSQDFDPLNSDIVVATDSWRWLFSGRSHFSLSRENILYSYIYIFIYLFSFWKKLLKLYKVHICIYILDYTSIHPQLHQTSFFFSRHFEGRFTCQSQIFTPEVLLRPHSAHGRGAWHDGLRRWDFWTSDFDYWGNGEVTNFLLRDMYVALFLLD